MVKFLASGQDVKREVRRIFGAEKGRRVAIVAFVGGNADAYLPNPNGLYLVCWPKAPGTNPKAIRVLIKKGVAVSFADRLHMKVYWTESAGAVVTSANLSTNAYGAGDLREAGVVLSSSAIDIDELLESVKPKVATEIALCKLEQQWDTAHSKASHGSLGSQRSFLEWLAMPNRTRWLLHVFNSHGGAASQRLRKVAKEETGSSKVENWAFCRKNEVQSEDFLLRLNVNSGARPHAENWLFVHRVVLVATTDKQHNTSWPYQAGQLYPSRACPPPPFRIDTRFRQAIRFAYKQLDGDESVFSIDHTHIPSKKLLTLIEKYYTSNGGNI